MIPSSEDIVTLDFETYYAKDYTLASGSMNTSEYVRDPRFKAHMVGLRIGTNPAVWYPASEVESALRAIDWKSKWLLCHNTAFDGFILSDRFGIRPKGYLDTLSMSRAIFGPSVRHSLSALAQRLGLGDKVQGVLDKSKGVLDLDPALEEDMGEYCCHDVDLCFEVYEILRDHLPEEEFEVIDCTLAMFCDPVLRLDEALITRAEELEVAKKVTALMITGSSREELNSNAKFAARLQKLGVTPPMKISKTTGKPTYAFAKTDAGFRSLQSHANPDVRELADARLAIKSSIVETRANRLRAAGANQTPVPVALNYCAAHTTRWSGGNKMNMQNLPRPEYDELKNLVPDTGLLRRSLLAPEGHSLVVCDAAQIEARITAWLCGQHDLVELFRAQDQWVKGSGPKPDVYKTFAAVLYNKRVEDVTSAERFIGKICILGLGYGMGATRLQVTLEQGTMGPPVVMTIEECYHAVDTYRAQNSCVKSAWRDMDALLAHMSSWPDTETPTELPYGPIQVGYGYVRLPNGLFLHYPGLKWNRSKQQYEYDGPNGSVKHIYGSLLLENIVQALSRTAIAHNMAELHRRGIKVVTSTHDELVVCVPEHEAQQTLDMMVEIMSTPPSWAPDLPLNAEGGYARNYSK